MKEFNYHICEFKMQKYLPWILNGEVWSDHLSPDSVIERIVMNLKIPLFCHSVYKGKCLKMSSYQYNT